MKIAIKQCTSSNIMAADQTSANQPIGLDTYEYLELAINVGKDTI